MDKLFGELKKNYPKGIRKLGILGRILQDKDYRKEKYAVSK